MKKEKSRLCRHISERKKKTHSSTRKTSAPRTQTASWLRIIQAVHSRYKSIVLMKITGAVIIGQSMPMSNSLPSLNTCYPQQHSWIATTRCKVTVSFVSCTPS